MDQRQTFDNLESLKSVLKTIQSKREKAFLLIDENGLSRREGFIVSVEDNIPSKEAVVNLDSGDSISLKHIVGVNGIFHSDYTEC